VNIKPIPTNKSDGHEKKHKSLLAFAIMILVGFSAHATTYTLTGTTGSDSCDSMEYTNDLSVIWEINTHTYQPVMINYHHDTEDVYDFLYIYSVSNTGVETLIYEGSGYASGSISTAIPSGRAMLIFSTDGSCSYADESWDYTGVDFSYSTTAYTFSQNYFTDGNSTIAGTLGIGLSNPLERLHINGAIRGSEIAGALKVKTDFGYVNIGPQSSTYADITTDRHRFLFNKPVFITSGYLSSRNTNLILSTTGITRMTILDSNGNVGIGTTSPTQALSVKGNLSLSPTATTPNESFNGGLMVTKPSASGQYLNLSRAGSSTQWSIGTVYNTSNFAIGQAQTTDASFTNPPFVINPNGNIGIGTTTPDYLLDVAGTIRATEVKIVSISNFADIVFDKKYQLPKLTEVDAFIQTNGHLPNIPTATEVKENGMSLVDMQVKLLQKIEELTLYAIEQQKQIDALKIELKKTK
jgi:hypothetical protein